jgi:hypothetical protein
LTGLEDFFNALIRDGLLRLSDLEIRECGRKMSAELTKAAEDVFQTALRLGMPPADRKPELLRRHSRQRVPEISLHAHGCEGLKY